MLSALRAHNFVETQETTNITHTIIKRESSAIQRRTLNDNQKGFTSLKELIELGQLDNCPWDYGSWIRAVEEGNEGVRVNLEARTRLPKRPAGLIKHLKTFSNSQGKFKKQQQQKKIPTLKIKLVIEIHISLQLRRLSIGKIKWHNGNPKHSDKIYTKFCF